MRSLEKFVIHGGKPLHGSVRISGAKNAAVAILPAVLLADGPCVIENLPEISDVGSILRVMASLGASIRMLSPTSVEINPAGVRSFVVSKEMAKGMRASSYFLGALLGRLGRARVAPPGGCDFGVRPIDQHIKGFEALGAKVSIENGMVDARCPHPAGSSIYLDVVSVGATINIILAAVRVRGLTVIENAAREPHSGRATNAKHRERATPPRRPALARTNTPAGAATGRTQHFAGPQFANI